MDYIRYTYAIDQLYSNLDSLISDGIFSGKKVYMFGSSKLSSMIIYYLIEHGVRMEGIVDNNRKAIGTKFLGLSRYSPDILADMEHDEIIVLIASGFQDAMIQQLEDMGYQYGKHIIKAIDLPEVMADYSFVDRTGYRLLTWEEVKASQMRVLRCLKRLCEKYGLRYYLTYGSLIGAVRHQGYIPWDDDIDVYININDFEKFLEVLPEEKDYGIASIATDSDYYDVINLLYDRTNICDSNHFPMQLSAGVTVDLFPLFGLPDTMPEIEAYYEELRDAELNMLNCIYSKEKREIAKKELYQLLKKYDVDHSKYVGHIMGAYNLKEVFPAEWFAEGLQVPFEGEEYCIPKGYDGLLKAIFGDYMQLPPEDQREGHHFFHAYQK